MRLIHLLAATALASAPLAAQTTPPPAPEFARIVDEGTNRSQVMTLAQQMTDVLGPRLTNSPAMRKAEDWAVAEFRRMGLTNVRKDGFDFGRGWSIERSSVRMVTPRVVQLTAIPIAWTPPVNATAAIVVAPMTKKEHFAAWRGKLSGKIVLVSAPGKVDDVTEAPFKRLSGEDIAKLDTFKEPTWDPAKNARNMARMTFEEDLDAFLKAEGAVALARISYRDDKLLHGEGYQHRTGAQTPGVEIAAEDYRRLTRLAAMGQAPTLEIVSDVKFDDSDRQAYNILADIPGTDKSGSYVMAGAHFDSWVAGDGATDNAAGSAMVMEAARIIRASGIRTKRTIRFALWTGEEQSLYGSISYIEKYLARRPAPATPQNSDQNYYGQTQRFPVTPLPGYRDLAAYFNIDNGSGKLRGIYAENNAAAMPILREWLSPFGPMGADSVVFGRTGGTDHQFMAAVGLPAFQFIQDPLDYESVTHHSGADTFDHLKASDMRQGAMVLAWMLVKAANADAPLPRNPIPQAPLPTDPFQTPDPNAE